MSQIYDLPEETDAGLEFDYSTWQANTEVTLCRVPWDNTYRDILAPDYIEDSLDGYIDAQSSALIFENMVPVRVSEPISIPTPFNAASRYNYVRAVHPPKPVPGNDVPKTYYYFIVGFVEDSPNSTRVLLQLDVWATYGPSVAIRSAFVTRGHIGIANENAMDNRGRDYLTNPEGLDIGSNYRTQMRADFTTFHLSSAAVLVCSNTDLEKPWFDSSNNPVKRAAKGGTFSRMPSGATFYLFQSVANFKVFMNEVSEAPHVAQGIISITLIPKVDEFWPDYTYDPANLNVAPAGVPRVVQMERTVGGFSGWREFMRTQLPAKYRHLDKFFTYPYMVVELTSFNGSPVVLRPELWNTDNMQLEILGGFVPPNQRMAVVPKNYNGNGSVREYFADGLDAALIISGFPTLAMVNDAGTLYMAQNARSLAFGAESAEWSRDKAARGNEVSYDQQTNAINTSTRAMEQGNIAAGQANDIANSYAWGETAAGVAQSVVGGAGAGAVAGPAGMVGGGAMAALGSVGQVAGTGMAVARRNEQLAMQQANARAMNDIGGQHATFMRDTNSDLASFAANGDYEMAIAGQLAKTQDAKISPNSVVGGFGGESFNLINDIGVICRVKMIDSAAIRRIGDYWLRYGYSVESYVSVMPTNLMAMSKFTYWKLTETYMNTAPMPEVFKNAIRGIFEKGVTVWASPGVIGSFTDNNPISGIEF